MVMVMDEKKRRARQGWVSFRSILRLPHSYNMFLPLLSARMSTAGAPLLTIGGLSSHNKGTTVSRVGIRFFILAVFFSRPHLFASWESEGRGGRYLLV